MGESYQDVVGDGTAFSQLMSDTGTRHGYMQQHLKYTDTTPQPKSSPTA